MRQEAVAFGATAAAKGCRYDNDINRELQRFVPLAVSPNEKVCVRKLVCMPFLELDFPKIVILHCVFG